MRKDALALLLPCLFVWLSSCRGGLVLLTAATPCHVQLARSLGTGPLGRTTGSIRNADVFYSSFGCLSSTITVPAEKSRDSQPRFSLTLLKATEKKTWLPGSRVGRRLFVLCQTDR